MNNQSGQEILNRYVTDIKSLICVIISESEGLHVLSSYDPTCNNEP